MNGADNNIYDHCDDDDGYDEDDDGYDDDDDDCVR